MADQNGSPASWSISEVEKVMQKLECPFTWSMDYISKEDDVEHQLNDDEEFFPLLQLMSNLMTTYVDTKSNVESDEILKRLDKCDDIIVILKENNHPEISIDVVNYILQSTKCFVFKQLNLPEKLKWVFSQINQDWRMNSMERSTLIACRSICWSKYHRMGSVEAERFIRDAIKENPNCDLWHFIFAKNLRRNRRDGSIMPKPREEEIDSFKKAYSMSENPVFGVWLAQMYREMWKVKEAKNIYNKVYNQSPSEITVLLRLALGFIKLKDYPKAKECLDKVEALSPNHSMYLHYRGIYFMNLKNYKEASEFLKEASKHNNIPAEKNYLNCAVLLDRSFDVVQYLNDMVRKYSRLPEKQRQPLLLDLAVAYWLKKNDIPNALKYFSEAVEINPEASCLTNYFTPQALRINKYYEKNMYQLLKRDILPIVHTSKTQFEQSCIDEAEALQRYCDEYFAKNLAGTLNSFSKFNVKN